MPRAIGHGHPLILLLVGMTVLTCAVSLAGFLGQWWWVFDLASHFRVQYVVVLLLTCAILVSLRHRGFAAVAGAFAILNLSLIATMYLPPPGSSKSAADGARALLVNVNTANTHYQAVLDLVARCDPDLLVILEVDDRWMSELQQLTAHYPHSISRPRSDHFGIALYSKHPFVTSEIVTVGQHHLPSVLVKTKIAGHEMFIFGTHALPPVSAGHARLRDKHLEEIAAMLTSLDAPVLLLGDLNTTPFSYSFRRLLGESGLIDGSRGMGYQPTWPAGAFPLLIPIDHCLHSRDLGIRSKETGPAVGSDHYPVIVDFYWRLIDATV